MDAIVLLKDDHKVVEKLFKEFEQAGKEEQEWFPQVRATLGRNRLTGLGEQLAAVKPTAPRDPLKVPTADR